MKRFRPAIALLLHLLLLQVSVPGGGMACALAWPSAASAAAGTAGQDADRPASAHHGGHAAARSARAHAGAHASADVPADAPSPHHGAPSHCPTAAGCAAVAVTEPPLLVATVSAYHGVVEVGRVTLPRSTHPAPEPPPPRA